MELQERKDVGQEEDRKKVTHHWILNGGETTKDYPMDTIREEDLLSYSLVSEILESVKSSEEKDELLMTKSSGRLSGFTSFHWVCEAANYTPSDDMMKLVKLLLEKISDANRTAYIETVKRSMSEYSAGIWSLILDNYDGDVIKFSSYLVNNDVYPIVLETIEDRYDDVQQALIEYSTTELVPGQLMVHSFAAWRQESPMCEILKRLTLQSRRYMLMYRDRRDGVTPLYLSRHASGDVRKKKLPGGYYGLGVVSESLIRMLNLFCNEYYIASGVNLISYTVDSGKKSGTMLTTYSNCYHNAEPFQYPIIVLSTQYVKNFKSVQVVNYGSLMMNSYHGYTYKIALLQFVVRSPPQKQPDTTEINEKAIVTDLPADTAYWFIFTSTDLKEFILRILRNCNGLLSMNQQLLVIRNELLRHQSLIYISSLQFSNNISHFLSSAPVNIAMICHDEESSDDGDNVFITHTYDTGAVLIMVVTVCVEKVDDGLIDLMNIPAMRITATNDTLPKVIFLQFILKNDEKRKFYPNMQDVNVKPFDLPTDCALCFMYTTLDMRHVITKRLMSYDDMMTQQRLSQLRRQLVTERSVIYISAVYSSLGRRLVWNLKIEKYHDREHSTPARHIQAVNQSAGSALIFYITEDRSNDGGNKSTSRIYKPSESDWRGELRNAEYILKRQLGLKVDSRKDFGSTAILAEVRDFAERTREDGLSVLVIMAHGDEKDQIITGDNTILSAQELVSNFSVCGSNPKIVILQYCRGPNRYNKLPNTYEEEYSRKVVRKKPKPQEYNALSPVRRVKPPCNFFLVYSTSSDSRSNRGLLFKCMKIELFDIWRYKQPPKTVDVIEMMTDVAGSVREKSLLYQHVETVDTLCEPLHLHLYPHEVPDEDEISDDLL